MAKPILFPEMPVYPDEGETLPAPPPTLNFKTEEIKVPKLIHVAEVKLTAREVIEAIDVHVRIKYDLSPSDRVEVVLPGSEWDYPSAKVTRDV